jgi:SAM-dependent methyltransferase
MTRLLSRLVQWSDGVRAARLVCMLKPHILGRTLDVGCWNGDVTQHLSDDILGIDVVAPPSPCVPVTLFDGRDIPFRDREFDTVLCCTVLHHAVDQDALLAEMKRVGKRIVILEDDCDDLFHRMSVLLLHRIAAPMIGMPFRTNGFRSSQGWRDLFSKHGLRIVSRQRHSGIMPAWPLLRHYLFVLDATH